MRESLYCWKYADGMSNHYLYIFYSTPYHLLNAFLLGLCPHDIENNKSRAGLKVSWRKPFCVPKKPEPVTITLSGELFCLRRRQMIQKARKRFYCTQSELEKLIEHFDVETSNLYMTHWIITAFLPIRASDGQVAHFNRGGTLLLCDKL